MRTIVEATSLFLIEDPALYGKNPTRPRRAHSGQVLDVQEMFRTIQGEGPDAGTPATFVRLWGCHLKCWFCDTDFESNEQSRPISNLVSFCKSGAQLVVLTGGEPMRQNLMPLITLLLANGHRVQIETAGSFWFQEMPHWMGTGGATPVSIVCSPKTHAVHGLIAVQAAVFKYVVSVDNGTDVETGVPVVDFQSTGHPRRLAVPLWIKEHPERIFLQPMDQGHENKNKDNRDHCVKLAMKFGYRLSLQTHKITGVP
jgi:7-carboxy-7-deazaguanine synthase